MVDGLTPGLALIFENYWPFEMSETIPALSELRKELQKMDSKFWRRHLALSDCFLIKA